MKIDELREKVKELKIPESIYSILKGGSPGDATCIINENGKWEVYYSDIRGNIIPLFTSEDEDSACDYFFKKLKRDEKQYLEFLEWKEIPENKAYFENLFRKSKD